MKSIFLYWLILLFLVLLIFDCSPKAHQDQKTKIYYPTSKGKLKEFDYYRITRRDLRTFKNEGIPDSVINKLRNVGMAEDSDSITGRSIFLKELVENLGFNDAHTYKNTILFHAKRFLFIAPEPITRVEPEYPGWLRKKSVEGLVVIKALIDTMGNVIATDILKSVPGLEEASLRAVEQFKFTQGIVDDPVKMWITIPFTYRLKK